MRSQEEIEHAVEQILSNLPHPKARDSFAFGYLVGRNCALNWTLGKDSAGGIDTGSTKAIVENKSFRDWQEEVDAARQRLNQSIDTATSYEGPDEETGEEQHRETECGNCYREIVNDGHPCDECGKVFCGNACYEAHLPECEGRQAD